MPNDPPTPPPYWQPPQQHPQSGWVDPGASGSGAMPAVWLPQGIPLVTIGDISCTSNEVITPSGVVPIGEVTWTFTDMSRTTKSIPVWAIVFAILFLVFCLLGLLFLLAKEERTEGSVQIVVQGPRFLHQVQLPVHSVGQVYDYNARVSYARSLSAAAGR